MKKLIILGSTGSIGTQALDIARANPDKYTIVGLAAGSNAELLEKQAREFGVKAVALFDTKAADELKIKLADTNIKVLCGADGVCELAEMKAKLVAMTALYEKSVATVTADKDAQYIDFHARRLVEIAGHIVMGYLLLQDTMRNELFKRSTENYIRYGEAECNKNASFIENFKPESIENYLNN